MTATETVLDVVAILRKCRVCHEWKPLEHFLEHQPGRASDRVKKSWRICAPCRGNTEPSRPARALNAVVR